MLALGEVDDLKYAAAAGAINYGFPVIADTVIPQILPTGVTTYEHVISMPFNEIEGKDDLERAEKLVQKCIEVRGVKIKMHRSARSRCPTARRSRARCVRKKDMRVEFGGKYSRAFEYLRMVDMDQVEDGKIEVIGPGFEDLPDGGAMDMGILVEVAGRKMQKDFEPVLERQIHYFVNGASGIQHIGQRDITWIRISKAAADKGFNLRTSATSCTPASTADFGAIVDKVQVKIITDPALFARVAAEGARCLRLPQPPPGRHDRRVGGRVLHLHAVPVASRRTTSAWSARSAWACAAPTTGWTARPASRSTRPARTSRSARAACIDPIKGYLRRA